MRPSRRFFLFPIALLLLPILGKAALPAPVSHGESCNTGYTVAWEKTAQKQGLLKRLARKGLLKHLGESMTRPLSTNGKWLAIAGFTTGFLVIAASLLSVEYVFGNWRFVVFLILLLALAGLVLSILGLIKNLGWWKGTWWVKAFAITGIVINALFAFLGTIVLRP